MLFRSNNVIENKNINEILVNFLNEIIKDLKEIKSKFLAKPNSNEFLNKFKSIFGKSFNEDEINNLMNEKDAGFEKLIKEKFLNKKNERIKLLGEDGAEEIEKRIFLQVLDQNWKMHIQYLEQLRQVIGLRSFGQRDPLVEYKKEAFALFENLLNKLKFNIITFLINIKVVDSSEEKANFEEKQNEKFKQLSSKKIGRNEPCPCNSGKKYKHCHGSL